MTIQELYAKIGGNYEDILGRLTKDSLVERFALMYPADTSFETLINAVESGNISDEFRAAHSLKGVSANLGFDELRKAVSELTEQLRPQTEQANPVLVEAVKAAHQKVIAGLQEYQTCKG